MTKILLVDDQPELRRMYGAVLRTAGHEVLEAENGEDGVALALSESPELVLMDVNMPVMDGITAVSTIKNDPAIQHIPVVMLTSLAMPEEISRGLEAGGDAYIVKPMIPKELLEELQLILTELDEGGLE